MKQKSCHEILYVAYRPQNLQIPMFFCERITLYVRIEFAHVSLDAYEFNKQMIKLQRFFKNSYYSNNYLYDCVILNNYQIIIS